MRDAPFRTLGALVGLAWSCVVSGGCSGEIFAWRDQEAGMDAGGECPLGCPAGWRCYNGQCYAPDDPCLDVVCPQGTHCDRGSCVRDDPCAEMTCPNPGEVCQNGQCVSGVADEDDDGYIARDDCNDGDATMHPGAPDVCDGRHEDCDEVTPDGADECPDFCCGADPACRECCIPSQCGAGDWGCGDYRCLCRGVVCDGECFDSGECCAAGECGGGDWACSSHRCTCGGVVCDGTCYGSGECCAASDCGGGDWACTSHACACGGVVCSGTCYGSGECCSASDCGGGDWTCPSNQCACGGVVCSGTCYGSGECCGVSDCGSGDWTCSSHTCSCPRTICGSTCCQAAGNVESYSCSGTTCTIGSCSSGFYDLNGTYSDGCECEEDRYGPNQSCASARNLGSVAVDGSITVDGRIIPSVGDDWYRVDFPAASRPGGGNARIRLTTGAATFNLEIRTACGGAAYACGDGGDSSVVSDFEFSDNVAGSGWTVNSTPWPSTVYFRVSRVSAAADCAGASYTVSITR